MHFALNSEINTVFTSKEYLVKRLGQVDQALHRSFLSGERTRLACWRWRPRHRELCKGPDPRRRVLILPLTLLQQRNGRRNDTATSACPPTASSDCAGCNLESRFSCSFVYVRMAFHSDPCRHLRPHRSFENSQVRRRARREGNRHRRANLRIYRACARCNGHPVTCQYDPLRSVTRANKLFDRNHRQKAAPFAKGAALR